MLFRILSLYVLLCCASALVSQNENKRWCFGSMAGLNFMNNPPTAENRNMSATEGCSSIADAAGNLKMYTDGVSLYNGNNQQMAGMGTPLIGGGNKQGTLIVKQPGNNPFYYIFVSSNSGFRYSIVDISLAAGMGSVTAKNVTLTTNAMTYKCAGTFHCNKKDIWIMAPEQGGGVSRAYLLTPSGLGPPILSTTSMIHNIYACMKFSPDGSKVASTEWGDVRLYDFNTSTGAVTGGTIISPGGPASWGIEFSPDGSKLYCTRSNSRILQWDLNAGSSAAISASEFTVYLVPNGIPTSTNGIIGALQLAPDGKIYGCRDYNQQSLTTINNPNALGAACNFSLNGISIAPRSSNYGLPNQVKPGPPPPSVSYTLTGCSSVSFVLQSNTINGVSSSTTNSTNWNFGDPMSGSSNSSTLSAPVHTFTAPGTYSVLLVTGLVCGGADSVWQVVNIPNTAPNLSVSSSMSLCMGESATLTASGANNYSWTSSAGIIGNSSMMVVNPMASTVYTVTANTSPNACQAVQTLSVHVFPPTIFSVSGNLNLCSGQSTTLTASGGAGTYSWMAPAGPIGFSSTQVIFPLSSALYTVLASTPGFTCTSMQTFSVNVYNYPIITVNLPGVLCEGQTGTLVASGAITYTWSNVNGVLGNTATLVITPTTNAIYTVSGSSAGGYCATQLQVVQTVNSCVGIKEVLSENIVEVFPNPGSGLFYLNCRTALEVKIFDVLGRQLYHKKLQAGTHLLDLQNESEGIYYCRLIAGSSTQTLRLVKHKP